MTIIACHYGGYHRVNEAEESVIGSDVILETSWPPRLADIEGVHLRSIIARHGAHGVVFGSDWPMTDPAAEVATIPGAGLDPADEAENLGENLRRVLGLAATAP